MEGAYRFCGARIRPPNWTGRSPRTTCGVFLKAVRSEPPTRSVGESGGLESGNASSSCWIACVRPRYRQSPELKEPPTGRMTVPLSAFKKPAGAPGDPEVFQADRDCIVP